MNKDIRIEPASREDFRELFRNIQDKDLEELSITFSGSRCLQQCVYRKEWKNLAVFYKNKIIAVFMLDTGTFNRVGCLTTKDMPDAPINAIVAAYKAIFEHYFNFTDLLYGHIIESYKQAIRLFRITGGKTDARKDVMLNGHRFVYMEIKKRGGKWVKKTESLS
jgi:hypothetical protein